MDELYAALRGRTSVFVGQSGVGKSSLINVLLPGVDLKVGALLQWQRAATRRGLSEATGPEFLISIFLHFIFLFTSLHLQSFSLFQKFIVCYL